MEPNNILQALVDDKSESSAEIILSYDALDEFIEQLIGMLEFMESLSSQRKISLSELGLVIRTGFFSYKISSFADGKVSNLGTYIEALGVIVNHENPTMALRSNQSFKAQ